MYKSKSAADSLTRMHRLLSYRFVQEIPICRTNSRNRRRWRMHPFFTFCNTRVRARRNTPMESCLPCLLPLFPSSILVFLFSRPNTRPSQEILLPAAGLGLCSTHTYTTVHTACISLHAHTNCQSIRQQRSADLTASLLWGSGAGCLCLCECEHVHRQTQGQGAG